MYKLPWEGINELILEAETATDRRGLEDALMTGLSRLIPNEAGVGVYDATTRCLRHSIWQVPLIEEYNERYRQRIPWVSFAPSWVVKGGTDIVRLTDYPKSVFLNEFARPNDMYQGLNPYRPGFVLNLAVQRSRSEIPFSARDVAVLDIVNGHFNNLVSMRERLGPAALGAVSAEEAREALPSLTRREAEALAWAAAGFTVAETATRLRVSPRTVEVHLQHAREKLGLPSTRLAARLLLVRCRKAGGDQPT